MENQHSPPISVSGDCAAPIYASGCYPPPDICPRGLPAAPEKRQKTEPYGSVFCIPVAKAVSVKLHLMLYPIGGIKHVHVPSRGINGQGKIAADLN